MGLRIANLVRAARGSRPPSKRRARFKVLRPVRPSKRNEIWYRGQLLGLVAHARKLVAEQFGRLRDEWPARTGDAAVAGDREPDVGTFANPDFDGPPRIQMVIEGVKRDMPGLLEFAAKTATSAATKNLAKIDDDLTYIVEQQLGVDVGPILEGYGPLSQQMRKAVQDNIELIRSIPTEYLDRVKETLSTAWQEGVGFEQAGKMLERDFATTESRAALIARDQTQKMAGQFNRERQQQVGIAKYKWRCTHMNTRPEHLAMETGGEGGKGIYRWDEPGPLKGTIDGEPCHPGEDINCLPGETLLSPSARILKAYRRPYRGQLTTLVTDSGETVSATPNHPVLTGRGWIPIQFVDVGDHVFKAPLERQQLSVGDPQDVVATADQVFGALAHLGLQHRVVDAASGFHGDVTDEKIDVVDVDWGLGDKLDPALSQSFCKHLLARADQTTLPLGAFPQLFGTSLPAPDGIVRGACKSLSLFCGGLGHSGEHALAAIARLDSIAAEIVGDGFSRDTKAFRELLHAHAADEERLRFLMRVVLGVVCRAIGSWDREPALAQLDAETIGVHAQRTGDLGEPHPALQHPVRVVEKRIGQDFVGHVYNLQTATGWYVAQNLIIHNCHCNAAPYVDLADDNDDFWASMRAAQEAA